MTDRVGQQIGNYYLTRLLERGNFAEIYLGKHKRTNYEAAIKVLDVKLTSSELGDFRAEIMLKHRNILPVLDLDVENDTVFVIMEYAPRGSLRKNYPPGSILPIVTVLSYVKQVADALQFAHDQGIMHRDINPHNMLLGQNNKVLVSDFGIALIAEGSSIQSSRDDIGIGTIAYMAPEQIQGKPLPASDQYALGIVTYEWLSGMLPFEGSFVDIAVKKSFISPPSLLEKAPAILPDVDQVVQKAISADPQRRFTSVKDFANAFEKACRYIHYPYDVALSYAGEDRSYADALAYVLHHRGVKVFYDKYEKAILWGQDLYTYLSSLYQNKARYFVLFVSKSYAAKIWTKHELKAAQARALNENREYILPIRLDDTDIPGLLPTTAYLNWHQETVEGITDILMHKLGMK
jgi:serine/threonine protein kinase